MVLPQVFGRIHLIYFPETPGKIGWVVIADFVHDPGYIVLPAIEEHRSLFHPHDAQEVIRGIPCDGSPDLSTLLRSKFFTIVYQVVTLKKL